MVAPRNQDTPPCEIVRLNHDLLMVNDQSLNALNAIGYLINPKDGGNAGPSYVWQHASVLDDVSGEQYFTSAYVSAYMVDSLIRECRKLVQAYDKMQSPQPNVRYIRNPNLKGVENEHDEQESTGRGESTSSV